MIDLGVFASHLFLRPGYQHYYFGDYYAANYRGAGFYPWFSINTGRFAYDPIYAHDRWRHRQDDQWEHRVAADFQNRRDHEEARPPRTWTAQRALGTSEANRGRVVAAPLDQWVKSKDSPMRFQPVDQLGRQELGQHGHEVQRFRQERQELETGAPTTPAEKPSREFVPAKVRLPRSPIVAKPADQLGRGHAPPKTYAAPRPDPKVQPKPRGESRGKSSGQSRGESSGQSRGKDR